MRWYSLLFSIIFRPVIPISSNHCNRQRIISMYSYICIMFYFCVRQNFVCHTKRVSSVPSHHQPAKWSSVVSPPLILPRKSILSPPLISPPVHADLPSHVTIRTVNQPREEAPCPLSISPSAPARSSVVLPPLIIPRKSIVLPPPISPPTHADSALHVSSRTINQPREEAPCLCRQSFHSQPVEGSVVLLPLIIPRKSIVLPPSISPPSHPNLPLHVTSRTQSAKRRSVMTLPLISPPAHARSSVVLPPAIIPRKSIILSLLISPPVPADLLLHLSSWTVDQPGEEASRLCRRSVYTPPLLPSCKY